MTLHSISPLVTFWLTETILNGEVKQCNKKAAESNPFGNFLRRAEKLGQKKAHPSRVCCKQSFITKGFFKRHDKNRGFPSLSLKRANIQLAGIYLADNHIRSPFAFAYIFCWQIIIGIISLLLCFVNSFMRVFLKTPPSRRLIHLAVLVIILNQNLILPAYSGLETITVPSESNRGVIPAPYPDFQSK